MNRLLYQLSYAAILVRLLSGTAELSFISIQQDAPFVKHYFKFFYFIFGEPIHEVKCLKIIRNAALFAIGGGGYVALEMLWRGRSHGSMFAAGGISFLLLGRIRRLRIPYPLRLLAGAGAITAVELLTGLLVNRDHHIWDYRAAPGNYRGQICPLFTLLWVPVSAAGMGLYSALERKIPHLSFHRGSGA